MKIDILNVSERDSIKMKKRLLTLLLSIAVILTSTVTVFAINIINSRDIFNTVDDITSWTNDSGIAFANLYDDVFVA